MGILQHGPGKVLGDAVPGCCCLPPQGRLRFWGRECMIMLNPLTGQMALSVQACVVKVGLNLLYAGCQNTTLCQCSQTFLLHRT